MLIIYSVIYTYKYYSITYLETPNTRTRPYRNIYSIDNTKKAIVNTENREEAIKEKIIN